MLEGPRAGDNTQTRALAETVAQRYGWYWEARPLSFRATELLTTISLRVSRAGVRAGNDCLRPPWPDVVISAGRRTEPVARWIQRQHPPTRLVHVGRPWSHPRRFDLIITTSQYFVPAGPNRLQLTLPLVPAATAAAVNPQNFDNDAPRPWIAVLVGGNSGSAVLDSWHGRRLGEQALEQAANHGGSLFITTSPRTPRAASQALQQTVGEVALFHDWQANAHDNPYPALLGHADRFIVTGDSASMLTEAAATGKPVHLYPVAEPWLHSPRTFMAGIGWRQISHRLVQWLAPRRLRRDITRLHQRLEESGMVNGSGGTPERIWNPHEERALAAQRVQALVRTSHR